MTAGACKVEGCPTAIYCKGFCVKHYRRQYRHGSPTGYAKVSPERLATFQAALERVQGTSCQRGHKRTAESIYVSKNSNIACRTCQMIVTWGEDWEQHSFRRRTLQYLALVQQ